MLSLCMKLLETDNEENAVICLRIIFDLHKNFRPTLEREVQPFLDFVQRIYQGRRTTQQPPPPSLPATAPCPPPRTTNAASPSLPPPSPPFRSPRHPTPLPRQACPPP